MIALCGTRSGLCKSAAGLRVGQQGSPLHEPSLCPVLHNSMFRHHSHIGSDTPAALVGAYPFGTEEHSERLRLRILLLVRLAVRPGYAQLFGQRH